MDRIVLTERVRQTQIAAIKAKGLEVADSPKDEKIGCISPEGHYLRGQVWNLTVGQAGTTTSA